jgi:hypothetical protein
MFMGTGDKVKKTQMNEFRISNQLIIDLALIAKVFNIHFINALKSTIANHVPAQNPMP